MLLPRLVGSRITRVHCGPPSYFFLTPPQRIGQELPGQRVDTMERRGKYLLLSLSNRASLLLHLGMTGQLFFADAASPRLMTARNQAPARGKHGLFVPDSHTHLVLGLSTAGADLVFRDVRKFGKVRLLAAGQSDPRLDKLGPDALSVETGPLQAAGSKRTTPIKTLLLDQRVLAGVGNIYADEALFHAGVRPGRAANRVSGKEYHRVAAAVRRVLARSIETGGSSISDYVRPSGADGGYQNERRVYARQGEPCSACGTAIRRIVVGQRSSHFCPTCQR